MRFAVVPVCVWGRPLERRDIANLVPVAGDVRVEYLLDRVRLRHLRVARLIDEASPARAELMPMLLDVQLVAMSPNAFTLSGFERIDGADYAQAWILSPPNARTRAPSEGDRALTGPSGTSTPPLRRRR
jgi:hypothetical protein